MTAFLFMPCTPEGGFARRVDLTRMASLFCEIEEPQSASAWRTNALKVVAAVLIMLCALGDSILVAPPDALAACLAAAHQPVALVNGRPAS